MLHFQSYSTKRVLMICIMSKNINFLQMASIAVLLIITLAIINFTLAFNISPLQDFCVADPTAKGECKDPKTATADDFFRSGLHLRGNTSNSYGASATVASASTVPGLNGLGLTFMRVDLAPNGFVPPHFHPWATELVAVLEGSMEVGFITSNPEYKLFSKTLRRGDFFVLPVGLVHYARNAAKGNSVAVVTFNSQNPGFTNLPGIFAVDPAIDAGYLAAAFKLDKKTVEDLQRKF